MIIDPYDLEAPRPRRRSKIGYDPYDPEVNEDGLGIHPDDLAPEERQGLLDALGSAASTTTGYLFDAINAGSSRVMDTLAGKELGSGSTGVDALENMALLPNKDSIGGWARPLAGFALEATTSRSFLTFNVGLKRLKGRIEAGDHRLGPVAEVNECPLSAGPMSYSER